MTDEQIVAEVTAGSKKDDLLPLWESGDDNELTKALNRKDNDGYVHIRHVVAVMASNEKWGIVERAVRHEKLPSGDSCPPELYELCSAAFVAAYSTVQPPLRLEYGDLVRGLTAMKGMNLIDDDVIKAITDGHQKVSLCELRCGYDRVVEVSAVMNARLKHAG